MKSLSFEKSDALMERARKVVPGGIYGHQNPLLLVKGAYPSFFARGEGSHIWDVDGNE
jgi:glutamate-1-semialdehyde 2,1-aminomutase